jgi:hypothetical protein
MWHRVVWWLLLFESVTTHTASTSQLMIMSLIPGIQVASVTKPWRILWRSGMSVHAMLPAHCLLKMVIRWALSQESSSRGGEVTRSVITAGNYSRQFGMYFHWRVILWNKWESEEESLAPVGFLVGSLFINTIYIYQNVVCYIKLEHLM